MRVSIFASFAAQVDFEGGRIGQNGGGGSLGSWLPSKKYLKISATWPYVNELQVLEFVVCRPSGGISDGHKLANRIPAGD